MTEHGEFRRLLEHARRGDPEAVDRLVRAYRGPILAVIRAQLGRRLRRRLDSEDILQTAMKSAFHHLEDFRGDSSRAFQLWLSRIALNDLRDKAAHVGGEKRTPDREQPLLERSGQDAEVAAGDPSPSQEAVAHEREDLVREALARLPPELQEVVRLKSDGSSTAEIARRLGVAERTVYRRYAEALTWMRRDLEGRGYGETGGA